MKEKKDFKQPYAWTSLFLGIFLGISFIILFTWKNVGISFPIFTLLTALSGILPVLIVEKKEGFKRLNWGVISLTLLLLLSGVFVYRLSREVQVFAFVTLPVVYLSALVGIYNKKVGQNFGILSYIAMPLILFVSWFVDLFNFAKSLKVEKPISNKLKSIMGRIFIGLLIALPFVAMFLAILASADTVFAKYINDFVQSIFKDWSSVISFMGKIMVGFIIFVFTAVFNFSLFNKDSYVYTLVEKTDWMRMKNWTRSWDVLITSAFMFFLNLVFVAFVVVQFVYLFGGDANVIGLKANFTYADYARRGFFELIVVAALVYIISYILNFKVFAKGFWQKFVYRFNHALMVIAVLVMSYSANQRLMLYESVYGYTNMRLFIHLVILCIALMYIVLYISLLNKNGEQFVNKKAAMMVLLVYAMVLLTPLDYLSARFNAERYFETKKIDLAYLSKSSDESIPVLIEITKNSKTDENVKTLILANLQTRFEESYKDKEVGWQSFNLLYNYNRAKLPEVTGNTDWNAEMRHSLHEFVTKYIQLIAAGDFDNAYAKYWSTATQKVDWGDWDTKVVSYYTPMDGNYLQIDPITQEISLFCQGSYRDYTGYYYNSKAVDDTLLMVLEGGEWKIKDATGFKLGTLGDPEDYRNWRHLNTSVIYDYAE